MTAAQFLIVIAALVGANLPFLHARGFLFFFRREQSTPFHLRLLELLILYFVLGGLAAVLETQAYASLYTQRWEFYAITLCLFLVLSYPGFVFRYLWKKPF